MHLLIRVLVDAAAIAVAAWLLDGITITGDTDTDRALTLLGVALILGLVNAFVAPVVKLLSLPFIILTLGLMLLVVNALMLLLVDAIAGALDLGFAVDGFWSAVGGALIISITSAVLESVLDAD